MICWGCIRCYNRRSRETRRRAAVVGISFSPFLHVAAHVPFSFDTRLFSYTHTQYLTLVSQSCLQYTTRLNCTRHHAYSQLHSGRRSLFFNTKSSRLTPVAWITFITRGWYRRVSFSWIHLYKNHLCASKYGYRRRWWWLWYASNSIIDDIEQLWSKTTTTTAWAGCPWSFDCTSFELFSGRFRSCSS